MNSHQQRKRLLRHEWLLTMAMAFALLGAFVFGDIAKPVGNVLYDHFMRLHGFKNTQDIVIVSVDDRALSQLGGWPLKRRHYTRLLEVLDDDRYRPKIIGFDFLFLDPTPDDLALAEQMRRVKTVLPLAFNIQQNAMQSLEPTLPVQPLADAASVGHINLSFDGDGVIRSVKMAEQDWPHFSLVMHSKSQASNLPNVSESGYQRFRMVDPSIGFPVVSLADVINDNYTRTLLKDKYVLVGVTAPSLGDRYPTLYSGKNNASTTGVAILASVLNASLSQAFIQEASHPIVFCLALLPLWIMLQSLLIMRPRYSLLLASLMMLAGVAISYALLTQMNYWVDPVPFILVAVLLQPLWAWRRLEAIVRLVENKAADLQQFKPSVRSQTQIKPSREVVLQYAKVLDHAVASARSELQFLSAIVDEMPDGVLIFDPQDRLLLSNQKVKQLIEASHLETGSSLMALAQRLQISISTLSNATSSTASTVTGTRELLIKTTQIDSPAGGLLRVVILIDITELRQSQTQRDRALQFLSHDMRTPIASILSLTQRPMDPMANDLCHDKITQHAEGLLKMMDDFILTISSEAPNYEVKQELLDNLLNDAMEQVADLADAKNIAVRDDSESSNLFVMANTRLLVRALVNLLFNAIKFSPAGSRITIRVSHTQAPYEPSQQAIIEVSNLVHITAEQEETAPAMSGFGLGLDFVDTVIHKHHGTIARNIPQDGMAMVVITLPCTSSQ